MSRIVLVFIGSTLIYLTLFSCASKSPSVPSPATSIVPGYSPITGQGEWDKILSLARVEGKVVVYGTGAGVIRDALVKGFKEQIGMDAEFTLASGAQIAEKLDRERKAGIYIPDVYIGGATTMTNQLKPIGALDPMDPALILPEVRDGKYYFSGNPLFIDQDHMILAFLAAPWTEMVINTDYVQPGEIKSYQDFLNPKWKGKILYMDPTIAGSALKVFGVLGSKMLGYDYFRKLAQNEPVIIRDDRVAADWISHGRVYIGICIKPEVTLEFIRTGAHLKHVMPVEGTFVTGQAGNLGLINKAPHPNAAKVFINWLLSKDGQTIFSRVYGGHSSRIDVPTDHLLPDDIRDPNINYLWSDTEEFLRDQPNQAKIAKEIFGPLLTR